MKDAAEDLNSTSSCESHRDTAGSALQVIGYCLVVIPVSTLILNTVEVLLVVRAPKLKRHTRAFLISLAACDLILGLVVMPFRIVNMVTDGVLIFGQTVCDICSGLEVLLLSASVWITVTLVFDRYIAVCRPFQVDFWFGRRNGLMIFITCWFVPSFLTFVLVAPRLNIFRLHRKYSCLYEQSMSCHYVTHTTYGVMHAVLAMVLPALAISVCSLRAFTAMARREMVMLKLAYVNTERGSFNRRYFGTSLSRTIITMATVSLVFWCPFFTLFVIEPFIPSSVPGFVWALFAGFCYSRSVINPVLYMKCTKLLRFRPFFVSK